MGLNWLVHKVLNSALIDTHVLNRSPLGVRNPALNTHGCGLQKVQKERACFSGPLNKELNKHQKYHDPANCRNSGKEDYSANSDH
jgi:hypothetical protein